LRIGRADCVNFLNPARKHTLSAPDSYAKLAIYAQKAAETRPF
jgi:hypothetical protein